MIRPVEAVPPRSELDGRGGEMTSDVWDIINGRVRCCEVINYGYSEKYFREALRGTMNRALREKIRSINKERVEAGRRQLEVTTKMMYTITCRKDDEGKAHWYVKYYPEVLDDAIRRGGGL